MPQCSVVAENACVEQSAMAKLIRNKFYQFLK